MKKNQKGLGAIITVLIVLVLLVGGVFYYFHDKQNTNSEIRSAQSVGDDFMMKVQKNDSSAALKLTTSSFQEHPSPYIHNSSLQQFQNDKTATSSSWSYARAKGNIPVTIQATYTTYVSVKADEEAHYSMTLQKISGGWLISSFDIK